MYISICLYIIITVKLCVLSIYPFIKNYTIVILCKPYNLVISIHNISIEYILFSGLFLFYICVYKE